ncbi:hypothetical protein SSPS47_34160 [Streptomyces sp. S4.7]|uniref:hypothetical protein n=1 Tax=Streptomyces sp. S4.7 TaxID=2705439 RepID=UPI001398B564|nr:hypothetical protein [Streptomyces sp. S4.7]QHZ00144.1 hypothetical protein SSPS47_34160 [Streptomyces sp. S4.7]
MRFAHASVSGKGPAGSARWPDVSLPPLSEAVDVGVGTGDSGRTGDRKPEWLPGATEDLVTSAAEPVARQGC